jgi:hypothetical protein
MLDVDDARQLSESEWKLLAAQTQLPRAVAEYFAARPVAAPRLDSRRQFHRKPLRGIALLLAGDERYAAFTKDLSRTGIGFFAPIHLFPKKIVELWLPSPRVLSMRVTRCLRIAPDCFLCGSIFESGGP